jgi:hypothetical protein
VGGLLDRLLLESAGWAAITVAAVAAALGWPRALGVSAALLAGADTGGLRLEARYWPVPAG